MVWKASGHVDGFSDPLVDCKKCRTRFRLDNAKTNAAGKAVCPNCESADITEPRNFNLMFKTHMGPVEDEGNVVYLRPETAQGIFVNFENVQTSMRKKIPFGIAQIGKSFRNEITPGNFTFRTREFEQMEMQYFVKPGTDGEWYEKWRDERRAFFSKIGIRDEKLRFKPHEKLAHYARRPSTWNTNSPLVGMRLRAFTIAQTSICPNIKSSRAKNSSTLMKRAKKNSFPT